MMFTKIVAVVTTIVGASSLLGVAALPTNVTESAIAARSINPAGTHTGQLTYFSIGLGACGWTNSDTEWVAAISHELYDNWPGYAGGNPNNNPVTIAVSLSVYRRRQDHPSRNVDRCEGCALWDLDLSPSAFQQFAPLASGRLYGATWHFN
ncbi:hypothetical protein B0J17DRAFT_624891 [Rhizoctonia solani]|nr:hypothetical protein B0J17DRAFT_624891 [Rhizoctonia solani]